MEQKNEILEISLTDIKPEKLLNHVGYQKLFLWTLKRMFSFRLVCFLPIPVLCIPLPFLGADIYFKVPIKILIHHILWLVPPATLLLFLHTLYPQICYRIHFKLSRRKYGDSYTAVCREDGIHLHAKKDLLIEWKNHRVMEGDYGIAIVSFFQMIVLIPKDDFPPEGYEQIRRWCSLK